MAVMTAQPPLPLTPRNARPVGAAAAIIEDDDGGRVFVHGNLAYAWDVGDTAGRRFAAVSLMRIKAATQLEVAEAFAVRRPRCDAGTPSTATRVWPGCCRNARAPNASRNSPATRSRLSSAACGRSVLPRGRRRHRGVGGQCSQRLKPAGADVDSVEPCVPAGSDDPLEQEQEAEPKVEVGPEPEVDVGAEDDCPATASAVWRHRR